MGNSNSSSPCTRDAHKHEQFACMMNDDCEGRRMICRNLKCGYPSAVTPDLFYCKLCKISEADRMQNVTDMDLGKKPALRLVAKLDFKDQAEDAFDFEQFFRQVGIEDETKQQDFKSQLNVARDNMSMQFDHP